MDDEVHEIDLKAAMKYDPLVGSQESSEIDSEEE